METISKAEAARKLGVEELALNEYSFLVTHGNARTPQRFWIYEALTKQEYKDRKEGQEQIRVII